MRMVCFGMSKSKRILVTGATSGVGYLIAQKLAKKGHQVIATGRNKKVLSELAKENILVIESNLDSVEGVKNLLQQLPQLDVAIFSAGIGTFEYAIDMDDEDLLAMINVNIQAQCCLQNISLKK